MKPSRRGFLGTLLGGAVAGPAIAKEAASMAMQGVQADGVLGGPIRSYGVGNYAKQAAVGSDRAYYTSRLAELRNLTKAERRERAEHMFDNLTNTHVESLRSISPITRERMRQEAWIERSHQREISHLLRTIAGME